MNIEHIERAILAEDFFPQYDNIYYKNLLRQYLYNVYKCALETNKEIENIKIQSNFLTQQDSSQISTTGSPLPSLPLILPPAV